MGQKFILVHMESLGGFDPSDQSFHGPLPTGQLVHSQELFPNILMDSKFMNFFENLLYKVYNGDRFIMAGQHSHYTDEPFNPATYDNEENLYYTSRLHTIVETKDLSEITQRVYSSLFKPSPVRFFYVPTLNEFIDKWDAPVSDTGIHIHPLPLLIGSCVQDDYDSDYIGQDPANLVESWANEPIIALDDSAASMIFLSVKRAVRIRPNFMHNQADFDRYADHDNDDPFGPLY